MSMAVLDVSGLGFELGISANTSAALPQPGEEVRLYTRMRVGTDAVALYGFISTQERLVFDHLVAISNVGPRLALAVLSKFTVPDLFNIIMAEDTKSLSRVSGVGKKTAQRLILELKSSLARERGLLESKLPIAGQMPLGYTSTTVLEDVRGALLSMGFSPDEAELALKGYDGSDTTVENLLGIALKRLGMGA